jgi:hypothetical protein
MIQEIQVGIVDTRVPGDAGAEMVAPHSLGLTCKTTAVQATTQSLAVSVLDLIATRAGELTGSAIAKSVELACCGPTQVQPKSAHARLRVDYSPPRILQKLHVRRNTF